MVSPLQSLVANAQSVNPLQNMGEQMRLQSQTNSNLQSQDLQRQSMQQGMDQKTQSMSEQKALGAARYLNHLGKQLLNTNESQWGQMLSVNMPQLQELGYTPEILQGLTRDKIQSVVQQTEPLVEMQSSGQNMVRSTENLPGGLTKTVMSDGSVKIINAAGETLTGQDAAKAVEDARKLGIDTEKQKYGARESGKLDEQLNKKALLEERVTRAKENAKNATGQIKEYFGQLGNIQANIANYNEAIKLIDEGANTGLIASKLPSIKAASQKLDNVKNRLGLDVVGNTTFGALSESELSFAISTALPDNIEGEELKKWITQKRDAQQKLADYIDNAIQYLNIEGNSLADLQSMSPRQNVNTPSQDKIQEGQTATNPQTGQTIVFRGGQWVNQ